MSAVRAGAAALLTFVCASGPGAIAFVAVPPLSSSASCRVVEQGARPVPLRSMTQRLWMAADGGAAVAAKPVVEEVAGRRPKHVVMEDVKGRTINVTMNAFLTYNGKRYCVGVPVDAPMVLLDGKGHPLDPADDMVETMFWQLDDYFANKGYDLMHTAGFLTVPGEPDWFDDVDIDSEDDTDVEDMDEDDDREEVVAKAREGYVRVDPIADVEYEGKVYRMAQLLDKVPLSAGLEEGQGQGGEGRWALVEDKELHDLLLDAAKKGR